MRMTRDGAVEENLTEGTSEKVSKRLEDAQLVAPHDAETGDLTEEVRKRRQLRPDELEDAVSQAQAETQSADAAQELSLIHISCHRWFRLGQDPLLREAQPDADAQLPSC